LTNTSHIPHKLPQTVPEFRVSKIEIARKLHRLASIVFVRSFGLALFPMSLKLQTCPKLAKTRISYYLRCVSHLS